MSRAASIPHIERQQTTWTSTQAYVLAVFCLVLGVALGYLFRGSASPSPSIDSTSAQDNPHGVPQQQLTPAQQKAMLDKAAAPLLDAVNKNPADLESLSKLGNLYFDGQQFPEAIKYYERALKVRPENADVITDLGTAYWYTGDADRALKEFQKSLKLRPGHAGTLFNLGVVRWQGKMDPAGAVKAWEELLVKNPTYPQRQQVEEFIAKAKQHSAK
jgi:cytochrome c-type biogenesis protein CcmH/NrfG